MQANAAAADRIGLSVRVSRRGGLWSHAIGTRRFGHP